MEENNENKVNFPLASLLSPFGFMMDFVWDNYCCLLPVKCKPDFATMLKIKGEFHQHTINLDVVLKGID